MTQSSYDRRGISMSSLTRLCTSTDSPPNDCFFGPSVFTLYARRVDALVDIVKGQVGRDDLSVDPVVPQAARRS